MEPNRPHGGYDWPPFASSANSGAKSATLQCRNLSLPLGERTLIMGILNVTPDSFSDGGRYVSLDQAVARAQAMVEEGADILDIGGESTRPGAAKVTAQEELERVIPVIRALRQAGVSVPLSVDTYKAEVARAALEAGAHMINDVGGLKADPDMAGVAAHFDCPIVVMHSREHGFANYRDLLGDMTADLQESIAIARRAGIRDERIVLDPGIGFGKSYEQNLRLLSRLGHFVEMGYPVLLGVSRKSVIQKTLNVTPGDALEGTAAAVALGIAQGCSIVRVHDVREMKRVAAMTDAILRS